MEPGNDKYGFLIEHLPDAFTYHKLITDDEGKPVDYIFLHVNRSFEEMFNLPGSAVIEKKIKEVFPDIKASPFDWIGTFGKVALTGENLRFEHYYKPRDRWYEITAYSDTPGFFVVLFRDITEKKQMEEEILKESKEKYHLLSENVSDVIWTADLNLKYTYVSQSVEKIYGYSAEEFLSFSVEKTLTQKSRDLALQVFHEEMAVEQLEQKELERTRTIDSEHICKSGSTVWVEVKMSFLRDERGYPTGILGVSRDISRRRQAEQALKESEEKLSSILINMPDAVWSLSWADCKLLFYNDNAKELYGYSSGEFNLQTITEMTHPDDRYQVGEAMKKLEQDGSVSQEFRLLRPDGTIIWIHVKARLIMDKSNNPVRIDGIARDITERKESEEALRESEARNRAILNSMPDLMFIFDHEGIYLDYHTDDKNLLAVEPSHFLGKSVQEVLPADTATLFLQGIEQAIKTKDLQIIDYALDLPDGSKHFEARIIPMDEQRLLAVVQDITPRKAAEQKLADHTLELEELYHQLEILLLETHHRVKNNLAVIISLLNMQQRLMGDGKAAATLQDLSNRIHAMALVHEKLYHSKNFSRINMQQYLQTLIAHLRLTLLPQRSIEYEVEAEGVELALDAAVPCALIIQELLTNAIKHAFPPDAPVPATAPAVIKVSLKQNKNDCELEVSDNGIGLPPGLEPANNRTIGLRLVRMIGEHQLGGRVELQQHSPRGGTKYKLHFALKQS